MKLDSTNPSEVYGGHTMAARLASAIDPDQSIPSTRIRPGTAVITLTPLPTNGHARTTPSLVDEPTAITTLPASSPRSQENTSSTSS